ncbi:MAG: ImmA/IrrE family metallo-endopeptidase [Ferruginibacter sp.]|nr:ImmA/IrrE family metallo-endopeptidase [Ferruginibacter sp.]
MKVQSELILEKQAENFRNINGFDSDDPIRLKSLLQSLNIITWFVPIPEDFSGMALKVTNNTNTKRFILINSSQSIGKQHFTICHELYHLYIQEDFSSKVCNTGIFNKKIQEPEEYNADLFARYLLLPNRGIIKNIPDEELSKGKLTLPTILHIEQLYSCSRSALLYSLKKMNLIQNDEYDLWCKNVKRSAAEYGYHTALYDSGNHHTYVGKYGVLAKELYNKDKISESHYYSLLADLGIDLSKTDDVPNGG